MSLEKSKYMTREIRSFVDPKIRKYYTVLAAKEEINRGDLCGKILEDYMKGKLKYCK